MAESPETLPSLARHLSLVSFSAEKLRPNPTEHKLYFSSFSLLAIAAPTGAPSRHTGYKLSPLQSVALHHGANLFFLPASTVSELSIFSSRLPTPLLAGRRGLLRCAAAVERGQKAALNQTHP